MYLRQKRQQGSMIILAIFIVVVMSLLATNLIRIKWSNQDTLTREALGTQAWFLAHSASEWALTKLYPIGGDGSLSELAANCALVNSNSQAGEDLKKDLPCNTPTISCTAPNTDLPDDLKYYRVTTSAICSSGTVFQVQRAQEVWLKAVGDL